MVTLVGKVSRGSRVAAAWGKIGGGGSTGCVYVCVRCGDRSGPELPAFRGCCTRWDGDRLGLKPKQLGVIRGSKDPELIEERKPTREILKGRGSKSLTEV